MGAAVHAHNQIWMAPAFNDTQTSGHIGPWCGVRTARQAGD